MAKSIKQEN